MINPCHTCTEICELDLYFLITLLIGFILGIYKKPKWRIYYQQSNRVQQMKHHLENEESEK